MGSGSSKDAAASSSGGFRKAKSRSLRAHNSSSSSSFCFGLYSILSDGQQKMEENGCRKLTSSSNEAESKPSGGNGDGCEKVGLAHHSNLPSLHSSDSEQCGEGTEGAPQVDLGASSSSATNAVLDQSSNTSGRLHSRFSFIPDGIRFRLNRAVSLGASGSHSLFSADLSVPSNHVGEHVLINLDNSIDNTNNMQNGSTVETNSSRDVARINAGREATISPYYSRSFIESRNTGHSHRRLGSQEPLEGNMRFSRTLSVGRLRDRVLRRTPFSDGLFDPALLEDRSVWSSGQSSGRRDLGGARRAPSSSHRSNEFFPGASSIPYRITRSIDINDNHATDAPQQRESSNRDVVEHRSAFLERRRRIRSQVRALQRLGGRFESLSGHDRSCILSGHHRTGHCTCRTNNQIVNPDEDTSTRASISRIVMLAEALFEVLDEIHRQSVVLSSRPSFSSIGSVPAPKEVVECIPIKIYSKPTKNQNEEAAQCYICLVEYEDGDYMRRLPCNHEFHRTCIDKWLKEIHRVCPLCRGDVCTSDASNKQKHS